MNQFRRARESEVPEQPGSEARLAAAPVGMTGDRPQREAPDPVAAASVAQHVAPPAGSRSLAASVAAVRNRSGARHDDDAWSVADARLQGDERVVDDENPGLVADPVHD